MIEKNRGTNIQKWLEKHWIIDHSFLFFYKNEDNIHINHNILQVAYNHRNVSFFGYRTPNHNNSFTFTQSFLKKKNIEINIIQNNKERKEENHFTSAINFILEWIDEDYIFVMNTKEKVIFFSEFHCSK